MIAYFKLSARCGHGTSSGPALTLGISRAYRVTRLFYSKAALDRQTKEKQVQPLLRGNQFRGGV